MKSAVTISLVAEARGGPFVFWDDLEAGVRQAQALGFDAVEVFAPDATVLTDGRLGRLLADSGLRLAAAGTGAGWVRHRLRLTDPDAAVRTAAREFVCSMVRGAAQHGAPAIVGSMQGRWGDGVTREQALDWLAEEMTAIAGVAAGAGVPVLIEPLNRYETNMLVTLADGLALRQRIGSPQVKLLADLYHMNIEEASMEGALREAGTAVGHVHFADSNRRAAGFGHTDFGSLFDVLFDLGYRGYVSAEVVPWPDSAGAARQTREEFVRLISARAHPSQGMYA